MEIRFLTAEDAAEWSRLRLEALERAASIASLEQVLLSVTRTQTAALALYGSIRFETLSTEPRALNINGESDDEHYLVRRLKSRNGSEVAARQKSTQKEKAP